MKRLIVMRHAKSSWSNGGLSDHQRPLNKRGRRDAPRVAAALRRRGWIPDVVLCSDAARTRETWALMAPELGEVELILEPTFYHGDPGTVLGRLALLPEARATALVLGHNPGWQHLVLELGGEYERFTTANAGLLQGSGDWAVLAGGAGWELVEVLRPKEL